MNMGFANASGLCPFTFPIPKLSPTLSYSTDTWQGSGAEGEPPIWPNVDVFAHLGVDLSCCNEFGLCVDPLDVGLLNCGSLPEPGVTLGLGTIVALFVVGRWLFNLSQHFFTQPH